MMCDFLDRRAGVKEFYHNFPDIEGFGKQIEEKRNNYPDAFRNTLVTSLNNQYQGIEVSENTSENIGFLEKNNSFTVTTGHQLNLFTGPLYFLYKIASVINLSKQLKTEFPDFEFIPVYWMASEDHDFDEICYFNFKGKKLIWKRDAEGPVGRMTTQGLDAVFEEFQRLLGPGKQAGRLMDLFRSSYLTHDNLSLATRHLANELFGSEGLVIIDGDDKDLKRLFAPKFKEELIDQRCFAKVTETSARLEKEYHIQVNPREINLFYITDQLRERIVFEGGHYRVNQTELEFTEEDILKELSEHPERFSPNVLMRPLYQEVILPNLSYTGGGGELAYWMQLKDYFKTAEVTFPILHLRNSALLVSEKQYGKMQRLDMDPREMFLDQNELISRKVKEISELKIDFTSERKALHDMFGSMKKIAEETDKSFIGAVLAQEKKQLNGLDRLEKRLLKAQKRNYKDRVDRIKVLQDQLFPGHSLQERQANFSEFYETLGEELVPVILDRLDPLKLEFDLILLRG
jgi:bacillithiol biosynthesis cysteine-adding enzyme BshC